MSTARQKNGIVKMRTLFESKNVVRILTILKISIQETKERFAAAEEAVTVDCANAISQIPKAESMAGFYIKNE